MVNGASPHGIARPAGRIPDPGAPLLSFGLPGYKQASGFPYEEWLLELSGDQGRRNYREMMDTSPVVGAARTALEALMAQVSYETVPAQGKKVKGSKAAQDVAEFVDGAAEDIEDGWAGHARERLGYLFWGWQWYESEFKIRQGPQDPLPFQIDAAYGHYPQGWQAERTPPSSVFNDHKIGWRRFGMRGQETLLRWEFTPDAQDLLGMWQIPPPDYRLRFIPAAKSFNYRTRTTKGNPEGFALLRNGWMSHRFAKGAMVHEGIGMERDLAGLPVAKVPPYLLEENPTADAAFMRSQIEQIVTNIRNDEQGGVIWPLQYDDNGREMFILELMSTGGTRQFDAQPRSAKVLTPSGWKRMGDLAVGDELVCPLGYPSRVEGVFPKGTRPVYRVTTRDGRQTIADARHRWVVSDAHSRHRGHSPRPYDLLPDHRIMRTEEIAAGMARRRHYRLPDAVPQEFAPQSAPTLDPYVLGVLLGDGHMPGARGGGARFYSADPEIAAEVAAALPAGDVLTRWCDPQRGSGRADMYRITGTVGLRQAAATAALDDLGLRGTRAKTKFIPEAYLWGTVEERTALLQGLLDTDGTVTGNGEVSFATVSPQLRDGVLHLIRSLGGSAGSVQWTVHSYRQPKDGSTRQIESEHYRIANIRLPVGIIPFRLPRKRALLVEGRRPSQHLTIKSIEPVGEEEVQCILVSSPSHMYITDDFIPTHNTDKIISRYEQRILMTFLADFLMIGTSGPGARALVDPRVNLFSLVGEAYLAQQMETFNQDAIPLLLAVNNIPQELAPRRRAGRVNLTKLVDLASYILSFAQANSYSPLAPDVQETMLRRADLPTAGTIAMLADQKQQAAQMAAMPPSVPQGRSPIATGGQAAAGRVPTKSPPPRPDASPRTGGQGARATTHRTPGRTATPMTGGEQPDFPANWPDWVAHEVADLWKERPSDLSPQQWGEILIGQGQRMVRSEARRSRPQMFEMGETKP